MGMALTLAWVFFHLTAPATLGSQPLLAGLGAAALLWVLLGPADVRRDDTLPALAVLLSALGLLAVARISPQLAQRQAIWLASSIALAVVLGPIFRRFRIFAAYKYIWIVVAIGLFATLAVFGQEVNGAKLWIRFGGVQFEPVEVIKLLVVFFMASYLAETADVIARTRPWSLRANAKYLGPLFIGWGASMAILIFEHDLGMATLLLATFAAMLYVATRRIDLIVGGATVFAVSAFLAATRYPYVRARIAVWQHPFNDPFGSGYQTVQSLFSMAAGGFFGTGYHLGRPDYIPSVATDYMYAAWSEEWGAIGAFALCIAFLAIVRRSLRVAQRQPDLYAKLLATGLAVTLGFQVFIIIGGVLRLFPLTGITLPFVSYGGSSLVTNYLLIALIWSISSEPRSARRTLPSTLLKGRLALD